MRSSPTEPPGSRNLLGQRLGRKGRDTRGRILAAASELVLNEDSGPVTLSAIARSVSVGMTSIYAYFSDLTELLLAVLEPVMAEAEPSYVAQLRKRWPDETLAEDCLRFVAAYLAFWGKHSRILHLRNSMADQGDRRMLLHRIDAARSAIILLAEQMSVEGRDRDPATEAMASMLVTAIERAATVATDGALRGVFGDGLGPSPQRSLRPAAHLIELAIRDSRVTGQD